MKLQPPHDVACVGGVLVTRWITRCIELANVFVMPLEELCKVGIVSLEELCKVGIVSLEELSNM